MSALQPWLSPWWVPALALACGLCAGLGGRTLRGGLYAGLVLLLSAPLVLPEGPDDALPPRFPPVQLTELVLPDLWQELPGDAPNLITLAYEPDALALRAQDMEADAAPRDAARGRPSPGRLHVGITALCLALMALVGVRGASAWLARALLAAGLAMVFGATGSLLTAGVLITVSGLALLAGLALGSLRPIGPEDRVAAALFLGAASVIVFGGLAGWAAWAGSQTPREVIQPALLRLAERGATPPGPLAVEASASHLVAVLDQGALAALAAMTALLLHLKGRRVPTAALVFLATAGELLVARFS